MFLYNYLSGKEEKLTFSKGKTIRLYTCGPTVYDYVHIGNLRTFLFEDLLRRSLKFSGFKVKQAMNLTDVDDKIIKRASLEKKNIKEITLKYSKAFFADIKELNIQKVEIYPRATEHIKEMLSIIGKLLKKGLAYKGKDGSIYFDISKFKKYGKLSRLKKRDIKIGARVEADEYAKTEAQDFVLWKSRKPGEPFWKSPYGDGRPGWHIECSAMSMKYLGESFEIHAGAVDLLFPHHENEIAQSEGATGKKFAKFWLEGEHILVDGAKMSKSLKNFFTLRDLKHKGFDPLSFRYLILSTHYRKKLNFRWESLVSAERALNNLRKAFQDVREQKGKSVTDNKKLKETYRKKFTASVSHDLNIPKALSVLWDLLRDKKLSRKAKRELALEFDKVLGLSLGEIKKIKPKRVSVPAKVKELVAKREKFRVNKQFIQGDALRKKVEALGYKVEDTESGPKISKS